MKKGIIIESYCSSSKVLLNRFTLFVESPYFNKSEIVKKLHYYLMKNYPEFDENNCSKENVWKNVFKSEAFNYQKLKDTNSLLLDLFEQFMVNEGLKKDKANFRRLEIQECLDNKLIRIAKKVINSSFKEIDNLEISQSKKYYHNYILNDLAYTYQVYYGDNKTSAKFLQKSINHFDKFYFSEKMLMGSSIVNRKKVINTEFDFMFFDDINKLILENKQYFKDDKVIHINQQLYLLQKEDKPEHYYNVKQEIKNIDINISELRLYYSFLNNYCIRMINSGKQEYLRELFELNISKIENNLLVENGVISEWAYKNIIALALRLKEFDWVENFIEIYSENLPSKDYLNAYNYNMANVFYFKKDYDKSQRLLLEVEYTNVFYMLSSKALLLKIYYESKEFELLDYLLHSFRLLVMRQSKISTKQKNGYLNLIRITTNILKLENEKISLSIKQIKTKIISLTEKTKKFESIADKAWILKVCNEFRS